MHLPPPMRRPPDLSGHPQLRLVPATEPGAAFTAARSQGKPTMSASAQVKPDFDGPEDRQLADDIARAMQHRPLMKRLARVEAGHGGAAEFVAQTKTQAVPAPTAANAPQQPLDPRSIEEVIDDLGYAAAPPPSAQWLDNARRAHREARMSHAIAWATTLAIAASIIGMALLLLRA